MASIGIHYRKCSKVLWVVLLGFLSSPVLVAGNLVPAAPIVGASSYHLMDFHSGKILAEANADKPLEPASLTKIMTAYVTFFELVNGNLKLSDKVTISEKAWRTGGSRMFIEVNKQVSLEDLLKGTIIQSGNDSSIAIAEHIAGNEATFAELMNQHAARLGMANTHFTNSTGLPDSEHYSTVHDLALLTRSMILDFPDYYKWHAIKEFSYNDIKQYNRNKLLWRDSSVDGVKTGHTEEAGYCLVASAKREDMRLISTVMGSKSATSRVDDNQALLNFGFRFFKTHKLYKAEEKLTETRIRKGQIEALPLGLSRDLYVTIPRRHYKDLQATMEIDNHIIAPITRGDTFGTVKVMLGAETIVKEPLVALQAIPKGNILKRLFDDVLMLID